MFDNMHFLPELDGAEKSFIQDLLERRSPEQAHQFASAYWQKRKDPHTVLLTAIIGLVAIPGFQRFWLGQIGMGLLYLGTWRLCLVGSIIDLANYKKLTFTHNQGVARQIATNAKTFEEWRPESSSDKYAEGTLALIHNRRYRFTRFCSAGVPYDKQIN